MAGIGFELKKIFKERSVINLLKGAFYSTFTVVGPMLITIISFMALFVIVEYQSIDYGPRDLLVSIILYAFVFSLVLTSPLSAVISRFIADKLFEENFAGIMPCYYTGLLINIILGSAFSVPFIIITVIRGHADPLVMLLANCMFLALIFVFYNMTFISALKEYKSIAMAFVAGMLITLSLSYVLFNIISLSFLIAVLLGMSSGFLFIGFVLFSLTKKFFKENNNNYKDFFIYLWRYKVLFFTNLFYILGLYAHNFVYWFISPFSIVVATTFHSAPIYDTSTFIAMLTNVSIMIIFTVRVETNFHEHYQTYCQQLLGGIGSDITIAKSNMFLALVKEVQYIVQIQACISIVIFMIFLVFSSFFGFAGAVMTIYPALAAAYFLIFIMNCVIIFLYYFDDGLGAFFSALTFFVITLITAFISVSFKPSLYGLSPFVGAFAGWSVAFFRLRFIEQNLDHLMYCKGELVKRVYVE